MLFYVGSFDGADAGTLNIASDFNRITHILHTFILILIVAIWQAVLIFKMMQTDESIQLSNYISYYDNHNKHEKTSLVFRLLNDGFNTIYNVKVTAFLRIKPSQGPYRHYKLNTRDSEISSLEVGMPYSIFIDTGKINNVGKTAILIDSGEAPYNIVKDYKEGKGGFEVECIPHPDINNSTPDECWIVILVEAFDDFLDQTNITKQVYKFSEVKRGEFFNIHSRVELAEDGSKGKTKQEVNEAVSKDKAWAIFGRDEVWNNFNKPFCDK